MKTKTKDNLGNTDQVIRIGKQAYRVYSKIVVEAIDDNHAEVASTVRHRSDGGFEMLLSEDEATSIDKSEQAILQTAWPAMREALAQHLTTVSKKKPKTQ